MYVGVTARPLGRWWEHREEHAILREKQLKRWHRSWKINLIESVYPTWCDIGLEHGFEPLNPKRSVAHGC